MLARKERKKISFSDSPQDTLVKMAEGNPGAIRVLLELTNHPQGGLMKVLHLDDMNIRGEQIWVAYKDHCGEDIERLMKAVKHRDPALVARVNQECPQYKAVTAGGSGDHYAC